jgi:hypothetical protein
MRLGLVGDRIEVATENPKIAGFIRKLRCQGVEVILVPLALQ